MHCAYTTPGLSQKCVFKGNLTVARVLLKPMCRDDSQVAPHLKRWAMEMLKLVIPTTDGTPWKIQDMKDADQLAALAVNMAEGKQFKAAKREMKKTEELILKEQRKDDPKKRKVIKQAEVPESEVTYVDDAQNAIDYVLSTVRWAAGRIQGRSWGPGTESLVIILTAGQQQGLSKAASARPSLPPSFVDYDTTLQ